MNLWSRIWKRISAWFKRSSVGTASTERAEPFVGRAYSSVRCPRHGGKTTGRLFQVGSVRLCEPCSKTMGVIECARVNGWKIRRVR